MKSQTFVGIDVSSATLDICIRNEQIQQSFIIKNEVKEIKKFFRKYTDQQLVIAMENTGRYNWFLYEALTDLPHQVFVVAPLHLKRSMGLVRGKNDKIDAVRITLFIEKNYTELKAWKPAAPAIQKLKILLTERNARIKTKRQLLKQQHDYSKMKNLGLDKSLLKLNEKLVEQIDKQIIHLESQIAKVIESDEQLNKQAVLMQSIPGVGKVLTWTMLAKTEGFSVIDDARKMACYSGVVPFEHQSGTSIKGRHRVSPYADKSIKSILHLAAMSAIRLNNDLQQYYKRKVAEGKNKMSVLNAVRNKIIHRIFAIIKSQAPYQNNLVLS